MCSSRFCGVASIGGLLRFPFGPRNIIGISARHMVSCVLQHLDEVFCLFGSDAPLTFMLAVGLIEQQRDGVAVRDGRHRYLLRHSQRDGSLVLAVGLEAVEGLAVGHGFAELVVDGYAVPGIWRFALVA